MCIRDRGEDVVAGVRTPMHISEMEEKFPEAFKQFKDVCQRLENHYRDMQDMEFTVEHGKLFMLQTRNGKRTAQAALKIACDLVDEGMITDEEDVYKRQMFSEAISSILCCWRSSSAWQAAATSVS